MLKVYVHIMEAHLYLFTLHHNETLYRGEFTIKVLLDYKLILFFQALLFLEKVVVIFLTLSTRRLKAN